MVQWLEFHAPIAGGQGSIPGQETKIPHATTKNQESSTQDGSPSDLTEKSKFYRQTKD